MSLVKRYTVDPVTFYVVSGTIDYGRATSAKDICEMTAPRPVDLFGVSFTMQRHSPGHVFVTLEEPGKTTSLLIGKQSNPVEVARSILQMVASHNLMRVTIDEGV